MFAWWIARWHWPRSGRFDLAIDQAYGEVTTFYGDAALETARRKLARRHQRRSRKWVWRAVVARLEAEAEADPVEGAGSVRSLPGDLFPTPGEPQPTPSQ